MGGVAAALLRDAIRKKGVSRVAPLALVKHVVKFDFQALAFLIGCGRESLQRKAGLNETAGAADATRELDRSFNG
jgi:hypothetical protein